MPDSEGFESQDGRGFRILLDEMSEQGHFRLEQLPGAPISQWTDAQQIWAATQSFLRWTDKMK